MPSCVGARPSGTVHAHGTFTNPFQADVVIATRTGPAICQRPADDVSRHRGTSFRTRRSRARVPPPSSRASGRGPAASSRAAAQSAASSTDGQPCHRPLCGDVSRQRPRTGAVGHTGRQSASARGAPRLGRGACRAPLGARERMPRAARRAEPLRAATAPACTRNSSARGHTHATPGERALPSRLSPRPGCAHQLVPAQVAARVRKTCAFAGRTTGASGTTTARHAQLPPLTVQPALSAATEALRVHPPSASCPVPCSARVG